MFGLRSASLRERSWWMEAFIPSPAALGLACVIAALRERVAAWGAIGVLDRALMFLLHRRLGEIGRRIEGMLARLHRQRLVRAGEIVAVARAAVVVRAGPKPGRVWPGRFGWLTLAGGYQAAGLGSQLRALLGSEEMVALLRAAPQARRVLRPLCRALMIETDLLRPGEVASVPQGLQSDAGRVRKVRVRRARVHKELVPIDFGRIGLPRGVLSWARREGFGKIR